MRMMMLVLLGVMACIAGCGAPSLLITPVSNNNELQESTVMRGEGFFQKKVVIIPIDGMIMNSKGASLLGEGENPVSVLTQELQKAADDPAVVAVVLRINSPGGTVTASDTMYDLVSQFKKKTGKPVIASVQEVGASGAYYLAMASDQIVAMPTSVVGSIGVVFTTFDVEGTLGKIGARTYTIKSGALKDMGSPFKAMTPEEHQVIETMIMEYFGRFEGIVQKGRKLDGDELKKVNDGRVFTGEQALALKLVDQLGSLEDAIKVARVKGGAAGARVVLYTRPYGYSGSIYANNQMPAPESKSMQVSIPMAEQALPTGFYYIWRPGL